MRLPPSTLNLRGLRALANKLTIVSSVLITGCEGSVAPSVLHETPRASPTSTSSPSPTATVEEVVLLAETVCTRFTGFDHWDPNLFAQLDPEVTELPRMSVEVASTSAPNPVGPIHPLWHPSRA